MDAILRAAAVYLFLMLILRITGRRTLSEMNGFDLVLLLLIGDASQQALLRDDNSMTTSFLVISALFVIDVIFSLLKARSSWFSNLIDGLPMVLVENGKPLQGRLRRSRVCEADILQSAREQGLESMQDIKYAVLESEGSISIIPKACPEPADTGFSSGHA